MYLCILSVQWILEADFETMELASDITPAGKVVRGLDLKYWLGTLLRSVVTEMANSLISNNVTCLMWTNSLPYAAKCVLVITVLLEDCRPILSVQWILEQQALHLQTTPGVAQSQWIRAWEDGILYMRG